jgi:hypothetical protein
MALFTFYRKRINESEWHFHTRCPKWPERVAYAQKSHRDPGDRLCENCIKLEKAMGGDTDGE